MRSARKGAGAVAIGLGERDQEVARSARCTQGAPAPAPPAIGDRRQRFVIDIDQRGGVLGAVARLRDHHRHRLTDEGDFVARQHERRDVGRQLVAAKPERKPLLREEGKRSASVSTASTCGCARAARVSMPAMRACGCGLRTNAASSMPERAGRRRSGRAGQQRTVLDAPDRFSDHCRLAHAVIPCGGGEACLAPAILLEHRKPRRKVMGNARSFWKSARMESRSSLSTGRMCSMRSMCWPRSGSARSGRKSPMTRACTSPSSPAPAKRHLCAGSTSRRSTAPGAW